MTKLMLGSLKAPVLKMQTLDTMHVLANELQCE